MRILYTTTIGLTMIFFKSLIKELIDDGHTVDIACNEDEHEVDDCYRVWGCIVYQVDWSRSPIKRENIKAIKQLKTIVDNGNYDIVHCHTPVAGVCTRLACKEARKKGTRVFYTAHGFHFYKGGPIKDWMLFYPVEKWCSRITDTLITINHEDYDLAKRKMKAKKIEYVPGVGIDVEKFKNTVVDKVQKRKELGIPEDAIVLLSVGELNENKNHQVVIRALAIIDNPNIHYLVVGEGYLKQYLRQLSNEMGVSKQIHILGYRNDVNELLKISNLFVHPSLREGLPVSVMEAKASGLTVIGKSIRGMRDIVSEMQLAKNDKEDEYVKLIKIAIESNVKDTDNECAEYSNEAINNQLIIIYNN